MTITPYSYLIIPFAIHKDGATKFRALIDKYVGVQDSLIREDNATWIPGRVVKRRYKGRLFRENMVYPHFNHIFEAFACNDESGWMMPPNDCYVFALNRFGDEECFDKPLLFDFGTGCFEFGIFNNKHSFDAVKMMLNINSSVGLLVVPVSSMISFDKYKKFIGSLRKISSPSIKTKDTEEAPWSIQNKLEEWMMEFMGCYHFFSEEALHLTYLVQEGNCIDDDLRQQLLNMVKSQSVKTLANSIEPNLIEVQNQLVICSSLEGISILTMSGKGILDIDGFKKYYGTEQTERYIITMSVILQRYALISMIDQVTKLGEHIRQKDTMKRHTKENFLNILREQVKSVSLIRIKNYFSEVSNHVLYNEFYQMCCSSFGINNLYVEIEQKMSMLNTYLTQQSDEKRERAEWQLSVILAILTVTSATNDIVQLASIGDTIKQPWLFIIGLSFAIGIFIFIFRAIFKNMR